MREHDPSTRGEGQIGKTGKTTVLSWGKKRIAIFFGERRNGGKGDKFNKKGGGGYGD